jgi:hypothetical protein
MIAKVGMFHGYAGSALSGEPARRTGRSISDGFPR